MWAFRSRWIALALTLSMSAPGVLLAAGAGISVALEAPSVVDRQKGAGDVGEEVQLRVTLANGSAGSLRLDAAAVHFATPAASVDGQYLVTRPAFPLVVAAGASQVVTLLVRPWATATSSVPVTVRVTMRMTDLVTEARSTAEATTSWRVAEGADLVLGQQDFGTVEGLVRGLAYPRGLSIDAHRVVVSDTGNHRVVLYEPVPEASLPAATVVLGQYTASGSGGDNAGGLSARSLSSPNGVRSDETRLLVADTGNNRVLIWNRIPTSHFTPADLVLGQPSFTTKGANECGLGARSLNQPTDVHYDGQRLYVADTGNHRVLIWRSLPSASHTPADLVLGQGVFSSAVENFGNVSSRSLNSPKGVWSDGARLFVADAGNHRVLGWNSIPSSSFLSADLVLGQSDFTSQTANPGGVSAGSLSAPSSVQSDGLRLIVTDRGNNRVLIWNDVPSSSSTPASVVVGQGSFSTTNAGSWANGVDAPFSAASDGVRLWVVDTDVRRVLVFDPVPTSNGASAVRMIGHQTFGSSYSNDAGTPDGRMFKNCWYVGLGPEQLAVTDFLSRVLLFDSAALTDHASASVIVGQPNASTAYNNNGGLSGRSLSNPTAAEVIGGRLVVSDGGNNRVLIYDSVPSADHASATVVIGQPNFTSSTADNGGISGRTLDRPRGLGSDGIRLFVVDSDNNRVLGFSSLPVSSQASASLVLGQTTMTSSGSGAGASKLYTPYDVKLAGGKLLVADSGNNRVLIWNGLPAENGRAANVVLGQSSFTGSGENAGGPGPSSLFFPRGLDTDGVRLAVADTKNHRVLLWDRIPTSNVTPVVDMLLGWLRQKYHGLPWESSPPSIDAGAAELPWSGQLLNSAVLGLTTSPTSVACGLTCPPRRESRWPSVPISRPTSVRS
ncbi:MAG: hypothetical protein HY814_01925 [Candidatus Riflebacteria bacterium]|nr:hypothetical protein [Candidatus Riflebacteria bacterium]